MYESPVKISYDDIHAKMVQAADDQILATIQQLVSVDKDELIRALRYDRGQYEKGYEDGKRDAMRHGEWQGDKEDAYYCSLCKKHFIWRTNYCPNCGARMR